jgi:hypothetical protein
MNEVVKELHVLTRIAQIQAQLDLSTATTRRPRTNQS